MRIAVAGKGGAGKTTISALLARQAAAAGRPTIAIDADPNPSLAAAVGVAADRAAALQPVPSTAISPRLDGPGFIEAVGDIVARYSVVGPDGIRVMMMGAPQHAAEGCLCGAAAVVSALLAELGGNDERLVVVDMEASPEHLGRGTIRHVDTALLVAEPYYRSLETVKRMAGLVAELGVPSFAVVANKVRSGDDDAAIVEFCKRHGFELAASVPYSDAVVDADRAKVPVADWPPARDVAEAVASLRTAVTAMRR
jgi:CO dehydrogenase maturation factor